MNTNIVKTLNYIKRNGIIKGYYAVRERLEAQKEPPYIFTPIKEEERLNQLSASLAYDVTFSILVPAYETDEVYMRELIDSVRAQTYGKWELIIADASTSDKVANVIGEYADDRIKYLKLESNLGISGNSNAGLELCQNEYTTLLDHDDVLTQDALFTFAQKISEKRKDDIKLQMLYSDEDKTNAENTLFFEPNIKPGFNLDLLLSNNYICHFLCIETSIIRELKFRSEYDGAQDHDLILRTVRYLRKRYGRNFEEMICHIPKVLYHWRCHEASTAANPKSKEYAYIAGKRCIEDYLKSVGIKAAVKELPHVGFYYVDYEPDIFAQRPEVGAIGCRMLDKHNLVADGIYDENMQIMYKGLKSRYSGGYLHRAACQMEVPYVNVKGMIPSDEAVKILSKLINDRPDITGDIKKLSIEFCNIMRANGYKFVYDPAVTVKYKEWAKN